MGNLVQNMSQSEYDEIMSDIKRDKQLNKPEENLIHFSIHGKSSKDLIKMKKALSKFYYEWELNSLNQWISYLQKVGK